MNSITAMVPLTYTMESGTAIIFLLSLWIGGCSGAFIGSVLLGIPDVYKRQLFYGMERSISHET